MNFGNNFAKSQPILKVFHCHIKDKMCKKFYHTLNLLLHHLVKRKRSKLTQIVLKLR